MNNFISKVVLVNASDLSINTQSLSHKGVLKRIQASDLSGTLRTNEIYGRFSLPKAGEAFILVAKALDPDLALLNSSRLIRTSEVVEIRHCDANTIEFRTSSNSIYTLENIEVVIHVH